MISLEEFQQDFLQSVLSDAQSRGIMKPQAFFENVCEELLETGDLTINYTQAEYIKRGIEIYGYDYDSEREVLSLMVHQFFQTDQIETLTKNIVDTKFKRVLTFFEKSINGFYNELEESFESYSMAYNIYKWYKNNEIKKVRLIILTDGKVTRNIDTIKNIKIDSIDIIHRIIDISYLYKIYTSQNSGGDFEISGIYLPALEVDTNSEEYKSFLCFINGETLANIYDEFGQKLLEQNVRTFLQFRGKVNKGLRNTIEFYPEMFFAYNNGITATASDLVLNNGIITQIKNFQIVNGGQTTSAIYAAKKNSKLDVSKINVQMKLSVVSNKEKQDEFVSKVSEYANTQNKVNKSDFFSNSPFHKEYKEYSKRIWAPVVGGSQQRTHWFYERVRGEYLNEQTYLTKAQKKQFQIENPKNQMINKTFLAKSENLWDLKPYIVSKGAQYSFDEFAKSKTDEIEKSGLSINEKFFKDSIARIIIFKEAEKIISKADWYNGGYRAQAVAYTIAYFAYKLSKQNLFLNFDEIWKSQKLDEEIINILSNLAKIIYENITTPPIGNANVGQWCKKELAWERVKKLDIKMNISDKYVLSKEENYYNKKIAKKEKKLLKGIEKQVFVVKQDKKKWVQLYRYYEKYNFENLTSIQKGVLESFINNKIKLPTERQSKVLYDLYEKAISEGYKW